MKARGTIAVMCALGLTLFGCGGNASTSSTESAASATSSASTADAPAATEQKATTPVGSWKTAALESEGITMTGDFAKVASLFGGDESAAEKTNIALELKEDGTGTMSFGSESVAITWNESAGELTIHSDQSKQDMTGKFEDGVITLTVDGSTAIMTTDGTYSGAKVYDMTAATAITSENDLVGTWHLSGVSMMGLTMQGDTKELAKMFAYDNAEVTFSAGGKVSMFGDETTYKVDANGAKIADTDGSNTEIPLLKLGDELVVDIGASVGTEGMYMVLGK